MQLAKKGQVNIRVKITRNVRSICQYQFETGVDNADQERYQGGSRLS